MQIASLSHSLEGTEVRIDETPWWVLIADRVGEEIGHHLRLLEPPEWTYLIKWGPYTDTWMENGKRKGWTEKSLGFLIGHFGQWVACGFGAWRHTRHTASIPVSYEWVQEHFPDAGWPWDGSSEDEMRSDPHDEGDIIL